MSSASANVAVFHGSLSNEITDNWPLGIPHYRFGFSPASGRPREYVTNGTDSAFIGRYTHAETSHGDFQYPQRVTGDVFGRDDFNIAELQQSGKLNIFNGGSRRGADILLNNVHSFDVEIWDARSNAFVDIAATSGAAATDFAASERLNNSVGSSTGAAIAYRNVFDTWHSAYDINADFGLSVIGNGQPPFVPKEITTGITDWGAATDYNVGDLVRPSTTYRSNVANEYGRINDAIFYECVTAGSSANDAADEPEWLRDVTVLDRFSSLGAPPSGKTLAEWRLVDNRRPVKAIRLTVRFLDPNSDQMRQVTMINSFNENDVQAEFN
ncbi:hypothetical protein GYB59_05985 [bacterium]|nr:hypothetical protein [bacterium]